MKDVMIMAMWAGAKTAMMAMAAYLIYRGVDGWGWFLFVTFWFVCGTSIKVD